MSDLEKRIEQLELRVTRIERLLVILGENLRLLTDLKLIEERRANNR